MNASQARKFVRRTCWLGALLGVLGAAGGVRGAGAQQPGRFLLIFETSPTLKKNLPFVRQNLDRLFASNLEHEIQPGDDLAVWTVDQSLHTGTFPLANWSADETGMYAERLNDFLDQQKYTRHATLTLVQPMLNRVVKNSERLTVIIVCDGQSPLTGTPYDSGVNDIITNSAAKIKNRGVPYMLVLRAYQGQYLGCSVNRTSLLNFPKFPPPPTPEPPPVVSKAAPVVNQEAAAAAPPVSGPIVAPVSALIIVGTNAGTNLPTATMKPAVPAPAPAPAINLPATNTVVSAALVPAAVAVTGPAPVTPPKVASGALSNPPPRVPPPLASPLPVPGVVAQKTSAPPSAVVATSTLAGPVNPPVVPESRPAGALAENAPNDRGYVWSLTIGGGALVAAAALVMWLVARSRRPRGSLITRSLQEDPLLPPRK
jgi:hypothetical protein